MLTKKLLILAIFMKKIQIILLIIWVLLWGLVMILRFEEKSSHIDSESSTDSGILRITFLDIGQGDATFVLFPDGTEMLIDCAIDARIIEALGRVMPFYDRDIDYLVVTHPDKDHYGGCIDVLERFEVKHIIDNGFEKTGSDFWQSYMQAIEQEKMHGAQYTQLDSVRSWDIASTTIYFLYPDHDLATDPLVPGEKKINANNTSIVMKLSFGNKSVLLTGDIEHELEHYLVKTQKDNLDADILKAGHHGSDTSSIVSFLQLVTPSSTIFSAGKENRFGHPSRRVIKRVERFGSDVWRTDTQGDILVTITNTSTHVQSVPTF